MLALAYVAYKHFRGFDFRFFEFSIGAILLFFTILMVQSSLFGASGGAVGSFAVDGLRRMIGSVGVWIFNITIFVL